LSMKELPVIGYPCLREELWDRQGANIASRQKMYGEKLFRGTRKRFLREINAPSPSPPPRMNLGNVDMRNMSAPARITVKYVIKPTDKLRCLREVYCETYIA